MTAMTDDLGQGEDVTVASLIADAHRRCRDCKDDRHEPRPAPRCEAGAWAEQVLAEYRRSRPTPPQQMTGRNQRPADYLGA